MKRNFVFIGLGLLAVVAVLFTNRPSPTQPPTEKKIVKWEYKLIAEADFIGGDLGQAFYLDKKGFLKMLNEQGNDGWEFSGKEGESYVFKRPK